MYVHLYSVGGSNSTTALFLASWPYAKFVHVYPWVLHSYHVQSDVSCWVAMEPDDMLPLLSVYVMSSWLNL